MAFIPDDAEDRFNELTPSAERFYIYLCKTRNHKARRSFGTLEECAVKYGWKRATKFHAQKELIEKKWIRKSGGGGGWELLVGDFSPVDKSKNLDSSDSESKKIDSESKNLDLNDTQKSKNLDQKSKNLDQKSKNLDQKSKNLDQKSKNLDQKSKNLDSHIRNKPALPEKEKAEKEKPPEPSRQNAAAEENKISNPGLQIYREFYPHYRLSAFQEELLAEISNEAVFRETLCWWAGKNYREFNIPGILSRYRKMLVHGAGDVSPPAAAPFRHAKSNLREMEEAAEAEIKKQAEILKLKANGNKREKS
jgi:hypothetical protein